MKQKTRNRVYKIFADRLSAISDRFHKDDKMSTKKRLFLKFAICDSLTIFVGLIIVDSKEGFVLELAVSPHGDYPFGILEDGKPYDGKYKIRLGELAGMRKDKWEHTWQIAKPMSFGTMMKHIERGTVPKEPDVSDEKITEVIDDALKVFQEHGFPFFEKIAAEKGLKIDWHKAPAAEE